ncbi:MAG: hypothetical protein LUG18_01510 [Candidatus Azobacteroides sp.]|nr:hypothetical protein [Candidatus Azobacteroides sp.]
MKKLVLCAIVLAGLSFPTFAQEENKECKGENKEATTDASEEAPAEDTVVVEAAE